jgi:uncharacterized protein (TIGR04255 family)
MGMGERMSNPPVYLVLAQVQFNAVLALDSYIPSIQESFRKMGFPDFRKSVMQTFNLNIGESSTVPVSPSVQYVFSDMEKHRAFILMNSALSYNVTKYDVFETFSDELLKGLEIVDAAVGGLSYTDRIGVRYLDAIFPTAQDDLWTYLNPQVQGVFQQRGGALVHTFSETAFRVNEIAIVSRVIVHVGPVAVPADLQPLTIEVSERFKTLNGLHASLDNDGYIETRAKYDPNKLKRDFFSIHDEIEKTFKITVTQKALEEWR